MKRLGLHAGGLFVSEEGPQSMCKDFNSHHDKQAWHIKESAHHFQHAFLQNLWLCE